MEREAVTATKTAMVASVAASRPAVGGWLEAEVNM